MSAAPDFDIFLATFPGLEPVLLEEVRAKGFRGAKAAPGGVAIKGGWPDVWRANLEIRGSGRVTARIDGFRASHLSELDKRARRVAWGAVLRKDVPVRVEATCKASRIYHSGAAVQRIETAIRVELGAPITREADVAIRARIEKDVCTLWVDTSGDLLHKRGHKEAVAKAPIRETMAALFLWQAGFRGTEPVLDPLCGSGTFVIEAAEIAAGLMPGRARAFAFEQLATFDPVAWAALQSAHAPAAPSAGFHGSDRDKGAIAMSRANAERAGVSAWTSFEARTISEIVPPEGPPGLVIANPPYGTRIGDKTRLVGLYRALGQTLKSRFAGWRAAIVTTEASLAHATGLPFEPPGPPVAHGGLRVRLFLTKPLA